MGKMGRRRAEVGECELARSVGRLACVGCSMEDGGWRMWE